MSIGYNLGAAGVMAAACLVPAQAWAQTAPAAPGQAVATPPAPAAVIPGGITVGGVTLGGVLFPGVTPTALPPPLPGEVGAPRIHIVSDDPVSLHEDTLSPDGIRHPIVCLTPCDHVVDGRVGRHFYFAGDGIPRSSHFLLTEKSGDVTVKVSTGSPALATAGTTFLWLGALAMATGAVLLPLGLLDNAGTNNMAAASGGLGSNSAAQSKSSPFPLVGGVMLGTGAAVLTTGIVMRVLGTTRYEFGPSGAPRAVIEPGVVRF